LFKITFNESIYVKVFFTILFLFYILQQVYPFANLTVVKTVSIYVVVVLGIIKKTYYNIRSVPVLFNIGFMLILLLCVIGVYQGLYSGYKYIWIYGDASKLVIFPLLFYFFYLNITSRDNFYSVILFISKFAVASVIVVTLLKVTNIVEGIRLNYLLSYIPIAYLTYKYKRDDSKTSLYILIFLLALIPFAKGVGSLVFLIVFYFALVLRGAIQIKFIVYFFFILILLFLIGSSSQVIDSRVLSKLQIIFSDKYSFIYIVEYVLAGRLTEFMSVIYGKNLIIGNGFGSSITPVLLDIDLTHWYDGLMLSLSHSMHSILAEVILKIGIIGFLVILYYFLTLLRRSFSLKTEEGGIIFAISVMLFQSMIIGQPLVDAFIVPMFLLGYIIKSSLWKKAEHAVR
jgi:hypothetical protein